MPEIAIKFYNFIVIDKIIYKYTILTFVIIFINQLDLLIFIAFYFILIQLANIYQIVYKIFFNI